MVSRRTQQIGGALMLLGCSAFIVWTWHTALHKQYYYVKAAMLFPAFAVLGLGLVLFPGYREERLARGEDLTGVEGMALLTPRWWCIVALALFAGGLNWSLLSLLF